LQERVVAVGDGVDGEASDAGPAEDFFGDDGSGEERSELEAEECDDRDERVAQGVAQDDDALGQALGAGGADVVLIELFEHGGADHAGEDGGEGAAHGDGGQDEMGEATGSADREPAELDRDEQDEDGAECEGREGQAEQADEAEGAVLPLIAPKCRGNARWDGYEDGDEERGDGELNGVRITGEDEVRDGVVEADRVAEVAVEDSVPVVEVLLAEGLVESVGVAEGDDVGGAGTFAEHLLDGVAGDDVDQEKDDGNDQPYDRDGVDETEEERAESAGKPDQPAFSRRDEVPELGLGGAVLSIRTRLMRLPAISSTVKRRP